MPTRRTRLMFRGLVALGFGLVLAACGSSNQAANAASVRAAAGIKLADCMRSHGVPNFPDPGSGGGINIPDGSAVNPQSPAFQSAMHTCRKDLPGGGPGGGPASEQRKLAMLQLARCMRRHGLPSFPDPTSSAPTPGAASAAGIGLAFGSPGSFIAVPQSLIHSPAFQSAAAACGFPGGGRPGKKTLSLR